MQRRNLLQPMENEQIFGPFVINNKISLKIFTTVNKSQISCTELVHN